MKKKKQDDTTFIVLNSLKAISLALLRITNDLEAIKRQLYYICREKDIHIEPEIENACEKLNKK